MNCLPHLGFGLDRDMISDLVLDFAAFRPRRPSALTTFGLGKMPAIT